MRKPLGYNAHMQVSPSSERIAALAGATAAQVAIEVVAETGSTNADLLARVPQLTQPVLRWALAQTAGRGRAGRQWLAPENSALTFSLAWRLRIPLQALSGLSLAVGVALSRALAQLGVDTRLKWPNDLLRDGAKLAGVLIETAIDRQDRQAIWVVIGIGLNLTQSQNLSAQLARAVADVGEVHVDREQWMAVFLAELSSMLAVFEQEGFAPFVGEWNALDAYAGREVVILDQGRELHHGYTAGVDASACLQLDTQEGRVSVAVGDVSLRMTEH
ncbi:biotin--[acetyl-CoA-carboxylase] ligase [uncultured Oxalicibacterium sp.]|uniref:biotin--[acetyl-CoA-carboxylase] ligase n=1 Tax=uncultured Oxalicibacterium sp. TaxID=1168540 RepID=UPI0025FAA2C2|nr:biotin--[acetyl-CoA-carboxylase] ligase [uncultured Oxalicibacterium sp.]